MDFKVVDCVEVTVIDCCKFDARKSFLEHKTYRGVNALDGCMNFDATFFAGGTVADMAGAGSTGASNSLSGGGMVIFDLIGYD